MRTLIATTFISLDGVMEAPGGGTHPHAGWTFEDVEFDEAAYEIKGREQEECGALLLGRRSYEEFSPVWPTMGEFERYNSLPKYVVSTTLEKDAVAADPWGVELLRGLDDVAALKETDGDQIQVHGSATLVQGLLGAGLVDRLHLLVFPLLLGGGTRLFPDDASDPRKQPLSLVSTRTFGNGITEQVWDVVR